MMNNEMLSKPHRAMCETSFQESQQDTRWNELTDSRKTYQGNKKTTGPELASVCVPFLHSKSGLKRVFIVHIYHGLFPKKNCYVTNNSGHSRK